MNYLIRWYGMPMILFANFVDRLFYFPLYLRRLGDVILILWLFTFYK